MNANNSNEDDDDQPFQPPPEKSGVERLNLLTHHKSKCAKCEMCSSIGRLLCVNCRVTFYCSPSHYQLDKDFHLSICSRLKKLRAPIEFHPLLETREKWRRQRRIRMEELYVYTWKKCQAHLDADDYNAAIPAATVSTQQAQLLYGLAEEMIPPLLVAAESYLNLGKVSSAESFLARALSIELTQGNIKPSNKAKIRHNEGIVALARGRLQTALVNFAEEIYQSTEEFGPEHIRTSSGFYWLGHIFHLTNAFRISSSLFRQAVGIWKAFLEPILEQMTDDTEMPQIAGIKTVEKVWVQDCDKFESLKILTKCHQQQLEIYKPVASSLVSDLDLAETCYALGIIHYICERYSESDSKITEAMSCLERGGLHPGVLTISSKLTNLRKHSARKSYQLEKMFANADFGSTSPKPASTNVSTSSTVNENGESVKERTI